MSPHHHFLTAEEDDCAVCQLRRSAMGLPLEGMDFGVLAQLHLHPDVCLHVVDAHQMLECFIDAVRNGLGVTEGVPNDDAMAVLESVFDSFQIDTYFDEEDILDGENGAS